LYEGGGERRRQTKNIELEERRSREKKDFIFHRALNEGKEKDRKSVLGKVRSHPSEKSIFISEIEVGELGWAEDHRQKRKSGERCFSRAEKLSRGWKKGEGDRITTERTMGERSAFAEKLIFERKEKRIDVCHP